MITARDWYINSNPSSKVDSMLYNNPRSITYATLVEDQECFVIYDGFDNAAKTASLR